MLISSRAEFLLFLTDHLPRWRRQFPGKVTAVLFLILGPADAFVTASLAPPPPPPLQERAGEDPGDFHHLTEDDGA